MAILRSKGCGYVSENERADFPWIGRLFDLHLEQSSHVESVALQAQKSEKA